jgi:hypothetical protein
MLAREKSAGLDTGSSVFTIAMMLSNTLYLTRSTPVLRNRALVRKEIDDDHPSRGRVGRADLLQQRRQRRVVEQASSRWVCWTRTSIHRERAEQLRQATSARHPSARRIPSSCWRYWARTGVYQERIGWLRQVAFSWRAFGSANWQTPQKSRMRSTSRIASLQRSASMNRRRGSIDGQ